MLMSTFAAGSYSVFCFLPWCRGMTKSFKQTGWISCLLSILLDAVDRYGRFGYVFVGENWLKSIHKSYHATRVDVRVVTCAIFTHRYMELTGWQDSKGVCRNHPTTSRSFSLSHISITRGLMMFKSEL